MLIFELDVLRKSFCHCDFVCTLLNQATDYFLSTRITVAYCNLSPHLLVVVVFRAFLLGEGYKFRIPSGLRHAVDSNDQASFLELPVVQEPPRMYNTPVLTMLVTNHRYTVAWDRLEAHSSDQQLLSK